MHHWHPFRSGKSDRKKLKPFFHIMSLFLIAFVLNLQENPDTHFFSSGQSHLQADDLPVTDKGIQNRFIINQMMYRNHEQQQNLSNVEKFISEEKYIDAISLLQVIFDSKEDSFGRSDHFSLPGSSRQKAHSYFEKLSPDLITTYEKLFGPSADQLFNQAKNRHSASAVREIVRRFFYTEAGFNATNWLGTRALDRGNYQLANQYFLNLMNSPVHRERMTNAIQLKSELCKSIMENDNRDLKTAQLIPSSRTAYKVQPASSIQSFGSNTSSPVRTALYQLQSQMISSKSFGNHFHATPPRLSPIWNQEFTHSGNLLLDKLLHKWKESALEHSTPLSTVNQSVVSEKLILYRDEKGIKAFDLRTGILNWKYDCQSSLFQATNELHRRHGLSSTNLSRISSYFDLQHSYIGNSIQGSLSSDQDRIYFVDGMDLLAGGMSPHGNSFTTNNESASGNTRKSNYLVALELNHETNTEIEPVWKLGSPLTEKDNQSNLPAGEETNTSLLSGHYFLGAPAVGDGVLYLMTEYKRQLNLVAVDSSLGKVLWIQGLGFVDKPIHLDRYRSTKACIPIVSGGTILCPLSNGLLVAIDSTTGQLMWSYYSGDDSSIAEYGSWGHQQSTYGSKGFHTYPHIQGDNIIYLPGTSNYIHCVSLKTGNIKWKIPRRDAEYIGTVTQNEFLLIGRRYCKSIRLADGSAIWTTSPGMPSGKGVCIGSSYLVPLQSGRITAIDLMTGLEIGLSQKFQFMTGGKTNSISGFQVDHGHITPVRWTPGNLAIANGLVISSEPGSITAFPQAGVLLEETEIRMEEKSRTIPDMILAAELNLTLGKLQKSRELLADALSGSQSVHQIRKAERLFRELLTLEISRGIEPNRALYQLAQLARTPVQKGEYLMLRSKHELESPNCSEIIQTAHDLAQLKLDQPLLLSSSSRHLVSKESWIPHLILKATGDFHSDEHIRFHHELRSKQQLILVNQDLDKMRSFITKYSKFPESDRVRDQLAQLLIRQGKFQEAEFLLLHNKESGDEVIAARASMHLVNLWNQLGITDEAAMMLHEMENRYQNVKLDDSLFVHDFRLKFSEDSLLRNCYKQQIPLSWDVDHVSIQETLWLENNRGLGNAFDHSRGRFWNSNNLSFHILNKSYNNQGQMALVHRLSGLQIGKINVPYRHDLPAKPKNCRSGHYIPMGSSVSMMGLSLLEYGTKEPLWKSSPQGDIRPHILMRAGPSGKSFSAFQSHHTLVVVNPVNGKILWQRNDLEANSGLINDQYSGLIGDDKVLVLFGSDRHSYTVYDTLTGIILYQGQLPANDNHLRNSFGRKFFYVANDDGNRRVRIWDPLHDELLMDEEVTDRVFSSVTPDQKLVLGTYPNRVRVLDIDTGKTCIDVKLFKGAFEKLNYIRGFAESGYYYFNLQRSTSAPSSRKFSYYASNTYLPVVSIQGELIAIDEKTQSMAWKMELPHRSVVHIPHYQLPFLVTISRVRDPWNSSRQSMLIEIIDRKTGQTIGLKDNIFPDRILHLSYYREKGLIELFGQNTKIKLDFNRKQQKLALLHSSGNY